jgi:hypothetical protein
VSLITQRPIARAWWQSEWQERHARRWASRKGAYVPVQLPPLPVGPRILPATNESVRAIRALEAITMNHVPLKETE